MKMEYDFVAAPTTAEEFEIWRREQVEIIENLRRDIETTKRQITRAQQDLDIQASMLERERKTENARMTREKNLFDMKWKVLESETQKLADERKQFDREKAFFSKVVNYEEQTSKNQIANAQIFFIGVESETSLKKRYKDLLKIYHPDNLHGDTGTIQEINREYDALSKKMKKAQ